MNFVKIPNQMFYFDNKKKSTVSLIGCNGFTLYVVLLIMNNQKVISSQSNFTVFQTDGIAISITDITNFNIGLLKSPKAIIETLQLLQDNNLIKINFIPSKAKTKYDLDLKMTIKVLQPFDESKGFEMIHLNIIRDLLPTLGSNLFAVYCYICICVRYSNTKNNAAVSIANICATFDLSESTTKRIVKNIKDNEHMKNLVTVSNKGAYHDKILNKIVQSPNIYTILALNSKHKYYIRKLKK